MHNQEINMVSMDEREAALELESENLSVLDHVHRWRDAAWPTYKEGSLFESAVLEAMEELQVTREMAVTVALGAMATSCQGLVDIIQPTGNRVNASLMLLTIAESGERKTTVEKQFFNSLRKLQKEALTEYEEQRPLYEADYEAWGHKNSAIVSLLKQTVKKDGEVAVVEKMYVDHQRSQPIEPPYLKFIYEDSTPQALIEMMHSHSRNACLLSSEANSIFNGRVFGELNLINSLWDGGEVIVDRVSKEGFHLYDARLTLCLMTQSNVIERFLNKRGEEARGMGFLARFLVVKPPAKAGYRNYKNLSDLPHLDAFNVRAQSLMRDSWRCEQRRAERKEIRFSATAAEFWRQCGQKIEAEMRENGVYEYYKDHGSKLLDNISRVAAVIQYFEGKSSDIEKDTLSFAYNICMRYSKHFLTHLAGDPEVVKGANLLVYHLIKLAISAETDKRKNYLRSPIYFDFNGKSYTSGYSCKFDKTDIKRDGPNQLRESAIFYRVIDFLKKLGHVEIDNSHGSYIRYIFSQVVPLEGNPYATVRHESYVHTPELKNGHEYTVKSLPLFDDFIIIKGENIRGINNKSDIRIMPYEK
ncbi:YfjI family protein [Thiomicrorhabdus cannonii]|uniref:YfjI family protein n=1 Tax=Thiomicrorhabdus cannonii TaxID=2748011 RepID=UPI0015BC612A|nr:YfjI family protein [Thiomicrorhabdus cannonii]